MAAAANVFLCIRGEDVTFCATRDPCAEHIRGQPPDDARGACVALGALCKVVLDGGFPLIACLTRRGAHDLGLVPGGDAVVEIEPDSIHLLAT